MKINFQVIPHAEQRYDTCGDYWQDGGTLQFRVSRLSSRKYEWLVFLHELIEYALCAFADIKPADIDAFDMAYEKGRQTGLAPCGCPIQSEPGFDSHAPYRRQHFMADIAERTCAYAMGVNWIEYEQEIDAL